MKRKLVTLLIMLLMLCSISLCGCSKDDEDTKDKKSKKKTESTENYEDDDDVHTYDDDEEEAPAGIPEFSDKIFIGASLEVSSSMEANPVDAYLYVYTDKTIVGLYNNEEIYRSILTDEQYANISSIDRKKLYNLKLKENTDVLDGSSYFLRLFGKDGKIVKNVGTYEPKNKYFNECRRLFFDNIPDVEIAEVFMERRELDYGDEPYYDDTEEVDPFYYLIDNWEGDYYTDGSGESTFNDIGITLDVVSEKANDITDIEKWMSDVDYEAYDTATEDGYLIECNGYNLLRYNPDSSSSYYPYMLDISDEYDNYLGTLDFSEYRVPKNVVEADKAFAEVWVHYAWIDPDKNVIYVSLAHSTYAESGPETGYIVAIDLSDGHMIWRTPSLTCNSNNFCVIEDTIVCGYGFTKEDDYIYQVDINSGVVYKKIKVKSSPDILYFNDGHLFVRCYNTDYDFVISYG